MTRHDAMRYDKIRQCWASEFLLPVFCILRTSCIGQVFDSVFGSEFCSPPKKYEVKLEIIGLDKILGVRRKGEVMERNRYDHKKSLCMAFQIAGRKNMTSLSDECRVNADQMRQFLFVYLPFSFFHSFSLYVSFFVPLFSSFFVSFFVSLFVCLFVCFFLSFFLSLFLCLFLPLSLADYLSTCLSIC